MKNDQESHSSLPGDSATASAPRDFLACFNDSASPYPSDRTIVDLFLEQVQRTPEAEAVRASGGALTYAELNERANQVAWQLIALGVRPGHLIVLKMVHSIEEVGAILGILKAGAAYVPMDPTNPIKRVEYILQQIREPNQTGMPLVVAGPGQVAGLPPEAAQVLTIQPDFAGLERCRRSNPERLASPDSLAYVIYTSGSTGEPKGVMIEHRSLVNYIWWANKSYVAGETLVWPLFSSLAFDLTVTTVFTPLISGGRIIAYHDSSWSHGTLLVKVIEDKAVNIIKLTPAHLALIKDLDLQSMGLRVLIVGGEDFKTELARAITTQVGGPIRIYNEYGPTEATVGCMIHCFDAEQDQTLSVPVGIPAANMQVFVLDEDFNPVKPGVIGQMYLAGDGLARGYLNRPDLTQQRFLTIADPRGPRRGPAGDPGAPKLIRVYQTGDLARWTEEGKLIFLGRSDHQVKIGGARIELGEIEARLQQHPDIRECVVSVVQAPGAPGAPASEARLAAYYVSDRPLTVPEVRSYLGSVLPEFMLPAYFIAMPKLPLTTNGKFDRAALPAPDSDRPDVSADYVEQRSATEEQVAGIWRDALKLTKIGIHDDFFELGGKSLPAIRILQQIKRTLGIEVQISALFANPTIAQLAVVIDQKRNQKK